LARRIPPQKIDEIYAAADIVEVIGEYVTLKKRGSNWFGLSPWANEKTPSFAVSQAKGIFKDFSSGKGGNVVTFLMELEGMTYVEALLHLAKKYNIHIEVEETPEETERTDHRESLFVLNEFASKYFHRQLLETETGKNIALTYFKERGILESRIRSG
jgi:DNA primase